MTMTSRQRTKVNAALSMIALHQHDPRAVQQTAKAHMAKGVTEADAYSAALEAFATNVPAIRETLSTILELVQHSDETTLASYDAAISQFNQTADNSALEALGPMIVEDYKSLIVMKGLATPDEAAALDFTINDALDFNEQAISPQPWQPTAADISAPAGQESVSDMTPLTPKQYAEAVRELRGSLKGRPLETSPEYAALQARFTGNAPHGQPVKAIIKDGQAVVPGHFTVTGYRAPVTGERARSFAGTPVVETE